MDKDGKIVGNYQLEGLIDLQTRFTAYNIGTLIFRETYMGIADNLLKWKECDLAKPGSCETPETPKPFLTAAVDHTKSTLRWLARDVVKGALYMTPAVPFFWASRTPQSKFKGLFINPEEGIVQYEPKPGYIWAPQANELRRQANDTLEHTFQKFDRGTETFFGKFDENSRQWQPTRVSVGNPLAGGNIDAYKQTFGVGDRMLNEFGKVNDFARKRGHRPVRWLQDTFGVTVPKRLVDSAVNASLAYTPYFYAKAEFANLWDTGRMDVAIERAVDGIASFNIGEIKKGIGEISDALHLRPLSDPNREQLAQERIKHHLSPADVFDPQLGEQGHRGHRKTHLEQLRERKEAAEKRMDDLRARSAMTFSEKAIADGNLERIQRLREPTLTAGFAAHEDTRDLRNEFAPLGTTIH